MNAMVATLRAASASPVHLGKQDDTEGFRKTAKIVSDERLFLAEARAILRDHAEEVIKGAFPGGSRNQCCQLAAKNIGVHRDTILRLWEGDVGSPESLILGHIARLYYEKTGKISPITTALAQIYWIGGDA